VAVTRLGRGEGQRPIQIVARPPNLAGPKNCGYAPKIYQPQIAEKLEGTCIPSPLSQCRFHTGGGGTVPETVARPPNLAVHLTHCGQLILGKKISKFDATRYHILRLKCTKFDFQTPLVELTTLPTPPVFKGAYF